MVTTSISLLERLRQPGQPEAWARFVELYTPLLLHLARRLGLPAHDAADFVQEVFTVLVEKLPAFTYDRQKSFRGWLRTVARHKWHDFRRRKKLPQEHDPACLATVASPDHAEALWEREFQQQLVRRTLDFLKPEFQPTTWKAFQEVTFGDRPAAEVARELGMTENAVYIAKSKVLRRLRQELKGLIDEDGRADG